MYRKIVVYFMIGEDLNWKETDTVNHRNSLDVGGCYIFKQSHWEKLAKGRLLLGNTNLDELYN